jgi:acyl-CoA synthetase (NDP forming)
MTQRSAPAPRSLERLLAPRSVALVGGAWADAVAKSCATIGYRGVVWRVHPQRPSSSAQHYFRSIEELPQAPDSAFLAVPNREIPAVAAALARRSAGGFVCFASGFSETGTPEGRELMRALEQSAADLPFLGPNCYGFVNFFDRTALWPDQISGGPRERGVAVICQSGTIALTLMFNHRSVPIGYLVTVGNQARLAIEDLIEVLADDARVTAFGLYVEGIQDPARFATAAAKARSVGKPIALVKAGRTEAAARTAHSHTGALAGSDVVFDAFCRQAGIARCESLATLCETLKVFHAAGPLPGRRVLVMGASGGDMAMTADAARNLALEFAPPTDATASALRTILSDRVTISNPFDFHTYIWFDAPKMRELFRTTRAAGYDFVGMMLDCPPPEAADLSSYTNVIDDFVDIWRATAPADAHPSRAALMCSLPETMPPSVREQCLAAGVVPLQGQREGLEAIDAAARIGETWRRGAHVELRRPRLRDQGRRTLTEPEAKAALAAFGVRPPRSSLVSTAEVAAAAQRIGFPVVLKAVSAALEHKSDVGAVILDVRGAKDAEAAARHLSRWSQSVLVEEMIVDGLAEILIGVTVDAHFGQVLVLGAGGTMTELLADTVTLLPPFTLDAIIAAIRPLRVARLLEGFRGSPPGDLEALAQAALDCSRYAQANLETLVELDINPIIVRPRGRGAVAVDALIRVEEPSDAAANS